ncbi:hypothetical protein C8R47DRAFT_45483 [Mycena vitilis]|nr:hypothetical protein C8R47DRAFT_45483 [Mycena vitilis]
MFCPRTRIYPVSLAYIWCRRLFCRALRARIYPPCGAPYILNLGKYPPWSAHISCTRIFYLCIPLLHSRVGIHPLTFLPLYLLFTSVCPCLGVRALVVHLISLRVRIYPTFGCPRTRIYPSLDILFPGTHTSCFLTPGRAYKATLPSYLLLDLGVYSSSSLPFVSPALPSLIPANSSCLAFVFRLES